MPLSVVMLDVDYFKKINDTYRHDKGDEVLKKLAEFSLTILEKVIFLQDGIERIYIYFTSY